MFVKGKIVSVNPQRDKTGAQKVFIRKDGTTVRIFDVNIDSTNVVEGKSYTESFVAEFWQPFTSPTEPAPFADAIATGTEYDCQLRFQRQEYQGKFYNRITLANISQRIC